MLGMVVFTLLGVAVAFGQAESVTNAPPARWHFHHCYKHVDDNRARYFQHSISGPLVKGVVSPSIPELGSGATGWWTSTTNLNINHRLFYHFEFPYNTKRVHIKAKLGARYTRIGCTVGRTTMMVSSKDHPSSQSDFTQFAQVIGHRGSSTRVEELVDKEVGQALTGTRHLWIAINFRGICDFSASTPTASKPVFVVNVEYDFECPKGADHVGRLNTRTGRYHCIKCGAHMPKSMYDLIVDNQWANGGGGGHHCADRSPPGRAAVQAETAASNGTPPDTMARAVAALRNRPRPVPRARPVAAVRKIRQQFRTPPVQVDVTIPPVRARQALRLGRPVLAMRLGR